MLILANDMAIDPQHPSSTSSKASKKFATTLSRAATVEDASFLPTTLASGETSDGSRWRVSATVTSRTTVPSCKVLLTEITQKTHTLQVPVCFL